MEWYTWTRSPKQTVSNQWIRFNLRFAIFLCSPRSHNLTLPCSNLIATLPHFIIVSEVLAAKKYEKFKFLELQNLFQKIINSINLFGLLHPIENKPRFNRKIASIQSVDMHNSRIINEHKGIIIIIIKILMIRVLWKEA